MLSATAVRPRRLDRRRRGWNVLIGNDIGTDAAGADLGNGVGVSVAGGSNTIGGANVIGFNTTAGVSISSTGNLVLGNFIGTDPANDRRGNAIGIAVSSTNNTIGGSTAAAANVIGFNSTAGVQIAVGGPTGDVLIGNDIGTEPSGNKALANEIGVLVTAGSATTIGGTTAGSANVISGNAIAGIELDGGGVSGILIVGNLIGTNPAGTSKVVQAGQSSPTNSLQNAGILIIGSQGDLPSAAHAGRSSIVISGNYVGILLSATSAQASPDDVIGNLHRHRCAPASIRWATSSGSTSTGRPGTSSAARSPSSQQRDLRQHLGRGRNLQRRLHRQRAETREYARPGRPTAGASFRTSGLYTQADGVFISNT